MTKLRDLFPFLCNGTPGQVITDPEYLLGELTIRDKRTITMPQIAKEVEGNMVKSIGYWERSYFYVNKRDKLRDWFIFERREPVDHPVINIRGREQRHITTEELTYIRQAIKFVGSGAIVVTDDPEWDEIKALKLPIRHGNAYEDFRLITAAPEIVIGRSTFSWWAAFLSDAKTVIQPEPHTGFRSSDDRHHQTYLHVPAWKQISL